MKLSKLYRRAAAIMEHPDYHYGACGAIERAHCGETHRCFRRDGFPYMMFEQQHRYFGELFTAFPDALPYISYWWGEPSEATRGARVIALYLAAEIAAEEGL